MNDLRLIPRRKIGWNPQPIPKPDVDLALAHLNAVQRAVESIRFFILGAEYFLSRDGVLREWLRVMFKIWLLITFPVVILMPTVTFALWQVAAWTAFLVVIAKNLIVLPLSALAALTLLGVIIIILKAAVRALAGS